MVIFSPVFRISKSGEPWKFSGSEWRVNKYESGSTSQQSSHSWDPPCFGIISVLSVDVEHNSKGDQPTHTAKERKKGSWIRMEIVLCVFRS